MLKKLGDGFASQPIDDLVDATIDDFVIGCGRQGATNREICAHFYSVVGYDSLTEAQKMLAFSKYLSDRVRKSNKDAARKDKATLFTVNGIILPRRVIIKNRDWSLGDDPADQFSNIASGFYSIRDYGEYRDFKAKKRDEVTAVVDEMSAAFDVLKVRSGGQLSEAATDYSDEHMKQLGLPLE